MSEFKYYPLDPTGLKPENRITEETHVFLTPNFNKQLLSPKYSPVFVESLKVKDVSNNRYLIHGEDYYIAEYDLKYMMELGKELTYDIVLTNTSIGSIIELEYQTLGGNQSDQGKQFYFKVLEPIIRESEKRTYNSIKDKPETFEPEEHQHTASEVYGLGPLSLSIKLLKEAIAKSECDIIVDLENHLKKWLKSLYRNIDLTMANPNLTVDKLRTNEIYLREDNPLKEYLKEMDNELNTLLQNLSLNTRRIEESISYRFGFNQEEIKAYFNRLLNGLTSNNSSNPTIDWEALINLYLTTEPNEITRKLNNINLSNKLISEYNQEDTELNLYLKNLVKTAKDQLELEILTELGKLVPYQGETQFKEWLKEKIPEYNQCNEINDYGFEEKLKTLEEKYKELNTTNYRKIISLGESIQQAIAVYAYDIETAKNNIETFAKRVKSDQCLCPVKLEGITYHDTDSNYFKKLEEAKSIFQKVSTSMGIMERVVNYTRSP